MQLPEVVIRQKKYFCSVWETNYRFKLARRIEELVLFVHLTSALGWKKQFPSKQLHDQSQQ